MNKEKEAKLFIKHLQKSNPECISKVADVLKEFVSGKISQQTVMNQIKESIRKDYQLVEKLNDCLIDAEKLKVLNGDDKKKFSEFIIQKVYSLIPQEVENFAITSIEISMKQLDHLVFFSIEELIDRYFQVLSNE